MDALFHSFFQYTITGLVLGSIYALVALGYTLVYGVLQLINFAHSEVFMYGTFGVAWVFVLVKGPANYSTGLASAIPLLLLAMVVAMLLSGGVALALERVAYRPLLKRNAPKLIALISAIGASFALSEAMGLRDQISKLYFLGVIVAVVAGVVYVGARLVMNRVDVSAESKADIPPTVAVVAGLVAVVVLARASGLRNSIENTFRLDNKLTNYVSSARDTYNLPATVNPHRLFRIGDYHVTDVDLVVIGAALLMMVCLDQFIRRTRFGRGIRAVAQDPESASLMGVNSTRVIQLTFFIGGLMAGAAATLYMLDIGFTKQDAGFLLGIKAFTAAVMGGIGNLRGALLGGLVLGVAENWGGAVFGTGWHDVVAFVLLILILLVRPSGLLGEALGKARA